MNDRHLFKAKTLKGNWIQGDLVHDCVTADSIIVKVAIKTPCCYPVEVIPNTVSQCTGLKDKNGLLIFENDIVRTHNQANIIKYIEGCFRLIGQHEDVYLKNYDLIKEYLLDGTLRNCESKFDGETTTLELIGTIHDEASQ